MTAQASERPTSPYRDAPLAHAEPYTRCSRCHAWVIPDRDARAGEALREHEARCRE